MESLDLPPPPLEIKDGKMAKWRVFGLRAASSLIWGDGLLFFDGGRGKVENFHMQTFFLNGCGSCCKRFFCGCLRQFLQTLFFLVFFQCLQLLQTIYFKLPPPLSKKQWSVP